MKLKDTPKNIYEESLPAYLSTIDLLVPTKSAKSKEGKESK
jgi:hypothetical protein